MWNYKEVNEKCGILEHKLHPELTIKMYSKGAIEGFYEGSEWIRCDAYTSCGYSVGMSTALPTDLKRAGLIVELYSEVIRLAEIKNQYLDKD